MRVIESGSNPRVQRVKKVHSRHRNDLFLIEGRKLFQEAAASGIHWEEIFVTAPVLSKERELLNSKTLAGVELNIVSTRVMKTISDLDTPPGILALARRPVPPAIIYPVRMAAFLISIRDPGNFGAIIRTAEASECEFIAYTQDCVDPFLPKVVRASMGSIFRLPLLEVKNANDFLVQQKKRKIQCCSLAPRAAQSIPDWRPKFPLLVCLGSESHGLPAGLSVDEVISIPMKSGVESLNAAVAASLCLYWLAYMAHRNV